MKNIVDPKEIHLISEGMLLSILACNDNENDSMSVSISILTLIDIFKQYEAEESRKLNYWSKREIEYELRIEELEKPVKTKLESFMDFKERKLAEKNNK